MSSVGQGLGGLVGGVIGFFVGGPQGAYYGAQAGMMIGGAIDPPKGPTINGPRLDDLSVQTSTYGAPIPRNYGTIAQTGNVFWLQGDALTEVQTVTESGGKGGGPVSTTNTWSYYATFAVGLCQGPIDGVRRIWIGGQLWYDAGSDDLATIVSSNQKSDLFTLYLGTDTQTSDPLIQADKGVANTPAYRGLAYIVFDALPLEKYSNSLMGAQVKAEIVETGSSNYLLQAVDAYLETAYPIAHAYDGRYAYICNATDLSVIDTVNASSLRKAGSVTVAAYGVAINNSTAYLVGFNDTLKIYDVGNPAAISLIGSASIPAKNFKYAAYYSNFVYCSGADSKLYAFDVSDPTAPVATAVSISGAYNNMVVAGAYLYCTTGAALNVFDLATPGSPVLVGTVASAYSYDVQVVGSYAYVACKGVSGGDFHIFDVSNPASPALVGSANNAVTPLTGVAVDADAEYAYLVGLNNHTLYVYDIRTKSSPTVVTSQAAGLNMRGVIKGADYIYTMDDTAPLRSWVFSGAIISSGSVSLGDIVEAECLTSNILTAGDLDVTALTDTVRGYRVAQLGAIRGALDPLRAAFPFDVVQHGYQIKFVRRGGASVATIPTSALDARAAGASPGVQVTDAREMDLMLPRKVAVNYVDVTREYETNQQSYERINTDAISERAVDLPIVFSAAEAAQTAEMLTYLYWMERHDVAFVLPPEYDDLEPADVITITGTDATWELRLLSTNTLPDGRIECRAKYNKAAIYTPVARGEEGQSTGGLLTLSGPCVYSLLDIPLMRDDDDTAGFPVAMAGYLSGWPGGILYRSDDSGQTWTDLRAFAPGAVIGYATTSLAAHGGTVYDFASTLAVRLYSGTLSSVTEAQLFAGQNWFCYGADGRWEIIAARTATLQGDGSYVLQDFLRGQHGTEWATGLHAANDTLVLLSATALSFISVNASSIGSAKTYRAITTGKALDSDADLSFTYTGVNLKCLSPVALTGNRHPSTNDWTLTWTRRSRYPGWRDYVDAALGEASESYEIEIYSNGTYTTLKRTLTASSATAAYTSAQQVTDFGSNQATLYLKVYQLSATVGRGYALTQSITR
jgi:hypothetical protein